MIGETAAGSYLTEPGTKKAIIRKALAGDGRTNAGKWTPRYLAFPRQRYTKRPLHARGRTKRPDDLQVTNRSRENERGRFFHDILLTQFLLVSRVFSIHPSFHAES